MDLPLLWLSFCFYLETWKKLQNLTLLGINGLTFDKNAR
jgi:hypothetical protein